MEEAFGYAFERAVLEATDMGLSTVWLAATIDRPAFERAIDEAVPAVSPLGNAAEKRSLRESAMRRGMKSDERLPFGSLFFAGDFDHPLSESDAGICKTSLQMVRKAPSATNKQPWRAVVQDGCVHFFEQKTRGYAKDGVDIQKVDLGIAGEIRGISQPRRTLFSPSSYLTKPPARSIHSHPVSVRAHPSVVIITMVEVSTPSCPMFRAMM